MDRYEEALERAKKGLPIDEVFPELKESEDERIRKELIAFICQFAPEHLKTEYVAYLERQKDERELSFIEGKVEGVRQTCQEIKDAMSLFEPKDLTPFEFTFRDYIDSAIRYCLSGEGYQQYIKEWAADLLNLERQKEQKPESCDCSRDEESYMNGIHHVLMNPEAYGLIKQQPAEWSEEDERKRQACISTINEVIDYERERWEDYNPGKPYRPIMKYDEQIDWLKSTRPQPHWKPSKVQMKALNEVANDGVLLDLFNDLLKLL